MYKRQEYNRITEGYSLYITDEEPEKFMCESENLALKRKILISDGINVSIICPSIVREGEEFIPVSYTHLDVYKRQKYAEN